MNAPVSELLPHTGSMVMLSSILDCNETSIHAELDPTAIAYFKTADDRIPAWAGIEFMAQAIAALSGIERRKIGKTPKLGFILGTRHYRCYQPYFEPQQTIFVSATQQFRSEENLVQFRCQLTQGNRVVAEADLKAIQPDDPQALINRQKQSYE